MADQPSDILTPHNGINRAQRPIWAADPEVPFTARVLAYVFGIALLATVICSIWILRPADPSFPVQWKILSVAHGITCPYPHGWKVEDESRDDVVNLVIHQPPNDLVRVELVMLQYDYPVDATVLDEIDQRLEEKFAKNFPGFRFQRLAYPDVPSGLRAFRANSPYGARQSVAGGWTSRVNGNRVLYLIGTAPAGGWPEMERIVTYMADRVSF